MSRMRGHNITKDQKIIWIENRHTDKYRMKKTLAIDDQKLWSHLTITELRPDWKEFETIKRYFDVSKEVKRYQMVKIWKVDDHSRRSTFKEKGFDEEDNMLLWHGTQRDNLVGILANGLKLPEPGPNDRSFGTGIYLADRVANSLGYTDNFGDEVLLLCQVSVGSMFLATETENYSQPPFGYDSLLAIGQWVPDKRGETRLGRCRVPSGPSVEYGKYFRNCSQMTYNEYVVYDPDRILVKYVVNAKCIEI